MSAECLVAPPVFPRPWKTHHRGLGVSRNAFFTSRTRSEGRNHPQSRRVNFIFGLQNAPICSVDTELRSGICNVRQALHWPPDNHLQSVLYRKRLSEAQDLPPSCIEWMKALKKSQLNFKFKSIPVTKEYHGDLKPWQLQLADFTSSVLANIELQKDSRDTSDVQKTSGSNYSKETGRIIPPPSRRGSSRRGRVGNLNHPVLFTSSDPVAEIVIMHLLCQILQTDDIGAVQKWLTSADQHEKALIGSLLRIALSTSDRYDTSFANTCACVPGESVTKRPNTGPFPAVDGNKRLFNRVHKNAAVNENRVTNKSTLPAIKEETIETINQANARRSIDSKRDYDQQTGKINVGLHERTHSLPDSVNNGILSLEKGELLQRRRTASATYAEFREKLTEQLDDRGHSALPELQQRKGVTKRRMGKSNSLNVMPRLRYSSKGSRPIIGGRPNAARESDRWNPDAALVNM